jgi:hypothetical protein
MVERFYLMRNDLSPARLLEIQVKNVMMGGKHTRDVIIFLGGSAIKFYAGANIKT